MKRGFALLIIFLVVLMPIAYSADTLFFYKKGVNLGISPYAAVCTSAPVEECRITDAYWEAIETRNGQPSKVNIVVEGNPACKGKEYSISLYEDDIAFNDKITAEDAKKIGFPTKIRFNKLE